MGKARTALDELGKDGSFARVEAAWRNWISTEKGADFPPEKGRYHLFVAAACPWAHRALMVRHLKGLEDAIPITIVHPTWRKTKPGDDEDTHHGWIFGASKDSHSVVTFPNTEGDGGPFSAASDGCEPNPLFKSFSIRDVYDRAGDTEGKYTVPILWDTKKNTIVSNESSDIIQMLNNQFNAFSKHPNLDLAPSDLKDEMEKVDSWIYPTINNGVYRCGFATSQAAYDNAITELTESIDRLDEILRTQRYICGDRLTLSDIRLFATLLRFDEVYIVYFKTNTRSVVHTPALLNYCREIYQMVAPTVLMDQIKQHYYTSHPSLNKFSIIPRGANTVKLLELPHDRAALSNSNKKQKTDAYEVEHSLW